MYSLQDTAEAVGFPIRTSRDQSILPAPPRFSHAVTSLIASDRRGIHRVRLFAGPYTPKSPRGRLCPGIQVPDANCNDSILGTFVPALASTTRRDRHLKRSLHPKLLKNTHRPQRRSV